ncbi:hypothetical protein [Gottfriedia solisilvae]|uniref:hypothetical protein n=1 Tax=Gottfriedia solisilvae TaxID=1516104 RepID=UPI003D2F171C
MSENFSKVVKFLLEKAKIENITFEQKEFDRILGNEKEIFKISQPGVYLFSGSVDGEVSETLYIGKTDKRNVNLGVRIREQYKSKDLTKSTIRKNAEGFGFKVFIKEDEYYKEANKTNYENIVFIESVTVWLFEDSNEGFAARDVLEMLLIAVHKPRFNKEFMYLRIEERNQINDDAMLEQATNQSVLDDEEMNGMTIKP